MSEPQANEFFKSYIEKEFTEHEENDNLLTKEKCADLVFQSIRNQLYMVPILSLLVLTTNS
jgi:hypothetical protein